LGEPVSHVSRLEPFVLITAHAPAPVPLLPTPVTGDIYTKVSPFCPYAPFDWFDFVFGPWPNIEVHKPHAACLWVNCVSVTIFTCPLENESNKHTEKIEIQQRLRNAFLIG
jgi:hypothetical protein